MEKETDRMLSRYRHGRREDLIPLLQEIQREIGYIPEDVVVKTGRLLGISTTKIYGVATFYDQFRFYPSGRIHIRICNGTSCFMNGAEQIVSVLREELGIEPGQTTRDGKISYEVVSCMGGCNNGPVVEVNGEYRTGISSEMIPAMVREFRKFVEID
ncbi:MAG: NAD(P)H-dependent oxidoreductase subunit E [Bacteroidales bacterium]|nr:NAD(P)H-dependent oxidoreductase subunit E [Bacteroidales bacterium]